MADPTPADRLALAECRQRSAAVGTSPCPTPCSECREQSPRPPLWRAMRRAESSCASGLTSSDARMIRAVRDWLVPEEEEDPPIVGYKPTRDAVVIHAMWKQRQRLRAILTAEIDRAERGECGHG